jgi:DNA-binding FrmR family transcriptional regulator
VKPGERKLVHGFAVFEGIAFLGALILFLVIIGNTLVRINDNLGSTASSANAVDVSAKTLPGLVDSITNSLTAINNDVKPIKGQLDSINSGLGSTQSGLGVADGNLTAINGALQHIEGNLTLADQYAHRVAVALIADDAGLAQVIAKVIGLINAAGGIHGDAANIGAAAVPINDHLRSISTKSNNLCRGVSLLPGSSC